MTLNKILTSGFTAAMLLAICASSQASAAMAAKATTAAVKTHSPQSIECSKQADTKGLHGKEREKFRAECKRMLKSQQPATTHVVPAPSSSTTKAQ